MQSIPLLVFDRGITLSALFLSSAMTSSGLDSDGRRIGVRPYGHAVYVRVCVCVSTKSSMWLATTSRDAC